MNNNMQAPPVPPVQTQPSTPTAYVMPQDQVGPIGSKPVEEKKASRIPLDFIAEKISEKDSNNFAKFAIFLVVSILLVFGAHLLHEGFFVEGEYLDYGRTYDGGYVEAHWTALSAFFGYWICLVAALVAWGLAWWQLGNVNALLLGLIVALAGYWAIGLFDGVYFGQGRDVVRLSSIVPIYALQQFALGTGLGLAGVSLWSYKYKSVIAMWFAYAGSVLILLTGFFAVASAV